MNGTRAEQGLHWLALLACGLPLLATHASLLISIDAGHFRACNPYALDCVSISKAARNPPASYFFKSVMLPYCVLVAALWWHMANVLVDRFGGPAGTMSIRVCGVTAATFLAVYVAALGIEGDRYQLLRKIGVVLSFTLTYMAQLLTTQWCWQRRTLRTKPVAVFRLQWTLLATMLGLGLVSVMLDALWRDYDRIEDAFEWWLALLLYAYFATFSARLFAPIHRAGPS